MRADFTEDARRRQKRAMNFLSKAVWAVLQPAHLLLLLFVAGWVLAMFEGTRRLGLWLGGIATITLVLIAVLPVSAMLLRTLENRFPSPEPLAQVDGIIVLGGGQNARVTVDRGHVALNDSAERLIEAAALMRRFPQAQVVFTGGNGPPGLTEADMARRVLGEMGVDVERVIFEDRSRNTFENAVLTRALVEAAPGETWLLVTSAFHMPRAVAAFRAAGWTIVPYPVDYRQKSVASNVLAPGLLGNLKDLTTALHEYVGLVAYRLMGRTDTLFPQP